MNCKSIPATHATPGLPTVPGTTAGLVPSGRPPESVWLDGRNTATLTNGPPRLAPTFRGPKQDQAIPLRHLPHTTSRRPGLLVVDDNATVLSVLGGALWHHGFFVWAAQTGQEALALYPELAADIDLVLLDVRMPGMDGPATLTALQQLNPEIRCCFMSGDTAPYTEEELLDLGAAAIFQKPFHVHEAAARIWQVLGLARTETLSHQPG